MTEENVGRLLTGTVVSALRLDDTIDTLLFSKRARVTTYDDRVYGATAELPEGEIREVLPRILVHVIDSPFATEQEAADGAKPIGECAVYVHTLCEADQEGLGRQIDARVRTYLSSTSLSDTRIIVSKLVPTGAHQPVRETAFRNAWRFTREFRTQAGVL